MSEAAHYPAGTYVKGDSVRVARTPAVAVALVFDGYALAKTADKVEGEVIVAPVTEDVNTDGPDRKELQRLAKEAGVPANLSNEEILAALDKSTAPSTEQN